MKIDGISGNIELYSNIYNVDLNASTIDEINISSNNSIEDLNNDSNNNTLF